LEKSGIAPEKKSWVVRSLGVVVDLPVSLLFPNIRNPRCTDFEKSGILPAKKGCAIIRYDD
jgi:hypothetical protein